MDTSGSGASRGAGDGIHNEDAFVVEEGLGLYVVCDGASDAPGGEVASRAAAAAVEEFVETAGDHFDLTSGDVGLPVVERAMAHAMRAVADADGDDGAGGLATTVTMLLAHRTSGVIGHRGDSRAYLIRRDRAHQLTVDHELTGTSESGESVPGDFDVFSVDLEPGDTIVLCTDGAEDVVQDPSIVHVAGDLSPRLLASRIVSAANRRSPTHDATAVVVRVRRDAQPGWLESSAPLHRTAFGHTLELA